MTSFVSLLHQGHSWLFVPSAVLLGALHGLEPGHSKTMMAAFIVAIRGTLGQAVLLALSATVSHTAIVWAIALAGLHFGRRWSTATSEPYFQVVSAVLIVAIAAWMLWRTRRLLGAQGAPHAIGGYEGLDLTAPGCHDPHELAHANDIRRRFAHRDATTAQIVVFGLTGGLIPCPASIAVLVLCLQLRKLALGAALVLCFSVGLALTLVISGAVAALGVRHAAQRFRGFGDLARRVPYFSGALVLLVGAYVGYQGLHALI